MHTKGDIRVEEKWTNLFQLKGESKRICVIADLGHETQEDIANAERIKVLWNASVDLTNEEAEKYLKYGADMYAMLEAIYDELKIPSAIELGELVRKVRNYRLGG